MRISPKKGPMEKQAIIVIPKVVRQECLIFLGMVYETAVAAEVKKRPNATPCRSLKAYIIALISDTNR